MDSIVAIPIHYYNRYKQQTETEAVAGEKWLRWTYEGGGRKLLPIIRQLSLSKFYGCLARLPTSKSRIQPFIDAYGIKVGECQDELDSFPNFDAFFTRKLKSWVRPIDPNPKHIVFPADGRHLAIPNIAKTSNFFIKGQSIDLNSLLADPKLATSFNNGTMVVSRLCPVDYHRFHFPASGTPGETLSLPGPLYSVNPIALRIIPGVLWKNMRRITVLDTDHIGKVLLIEVGATFVGKIEQTYTPREKVKKGAEKGYFSFGGSTVITLFEPGKIRLSEDLLEQNALGIELYAKMGDTMGYSEECR